MPGLIAVGLDVQLVEPDFTKNNGVGLVCATLATADAILLGLLDLPVD